MNQSDLDNLIEALFESSHFKLLLSQQFRNTPPPKQSKFSEVQTLMQDISENLHSIIHFKIKQSIDEDLFTLIPSAVDYRKEIDQLKIDVEKLQSIRQTTEGSEKLKNLLRTDKLFETSTMSDRTKSTLNSENLQLTKIKQELDHLKVTVNKFSSNNILQFVSEAHLEINHKMDENFARLNTEIHELSMRNSETDLDRSTHSVLNFSNENEISERVLEKMQKYLKEIEAKLESGLRSVWNVITDMQDNLNPKRNSPSEGSGSSASPSQQEVFGSPSQKTIKKGSSIASLLGWKS